MQHEQRAGYLACSKSDYGEEKVDNVQSVITISRVTWGLGAWLSCP